MPNQKLTGVRIATLKPLPGQARTQYFDSAYPGLCLRVGLRDKSWCYYFRFNGRKQYKSLGKYALGRSDHMDRVAAIKAADEIEKTIEKGLHPTATPIRVKQKPTVKNPNAFTQRVQQFLTYYERQVKPKTFVHASGLLTGSHVAAIANSDIGKISRSQITELLECMHETPIQANRLQSYLSKFFGWCWDHEYCDPSPMVRLQKRFKEKPRKRNLDADEIEELWNGCVELGYPLGDWCLFALATGQRPGECRNLSHDDIHNDIWLVEGGDPKNDERHRIPLPKIARALIKDAPQLEGPFVFSTADGHKPFLQGGKLYRYLYDAVGLNEPWRPHDLRRTFQTRASEELDIEPHLLGAICNQMSVAKPGVSNIYNQAKWMKPKKKALEAWNRWLLEVVSS